MGKRSWLEPVEQNEKFEVRATRDIRAPRQLVWALIKPAENAPIFDPQVTRAFRAEGTPSGVGEVQVFFFVRDGIEQVTAAEITGEVTAEYSIMRSIGAGQFPPRTGYFLADTTIGTQLELRYELCLPNMRAKEVRHLLSAYEVSARELLERVKTEAERRYEQDSPGLRAWNESDPV